MKKSTGSNKLQMGNVPYHNTSLLLQNYRKAMWSVEVAMRDIKKEFKDAFFMEVDEFLDSMYSAGADVGGMHLESYARSVERTAKILEIIRNTLEFVRTHHSRGEEYYQILYLSYIIPSELRMDEIIRRMETFGYYYSERTLYRKKREAISVVSMALWGYESRDFAELFQFEEDRKKVG